MFEESNAGQPVALIEHHRYSSPPKAPNWPRCGWHKVVAQFGPWEDCESPLLRTPGRRRDVISWGFVLGPGPERTSETGWDKRRTNYRGEFIEESE